MNELNNTGLRVPMSDDDAYRMFMQQMPDWVFEPICGCQVPDPEPKTFHEAMKLLTTVSKERDILQIRLDDIQSSLETAI